MSCQLCTDIPRLPHKNLRNLMTCNLYFSIVMFWFHCIKRFVHGTNLWSFSNWNKSKCFAATHISFISYSDFNQDLPLARIMVLTLALDPELGGTIQHANANLSGVEYHSAKEGIFPAIAEDQNVPCARCFIKWTASMMLPGKRTCPDSWVKEYQGRVLVNLLTCEV